MNVEEALLILDTALQPKFLNNIQEIVFRQAWSGQTYQEIANSAGYNANYIKDVGYKLWKLLSKVFEEVVTKSNFQSVLRRRYFAFQLACFSPNAEREELPSALPEDSSEVSGSVVQRKEIASPKQIESQQTPVDKQFKIQNSKFKIRNEKNQCLQASCLLNTCKLNLGQLTKLLFPGKN